MNNPYQAPIMNNYLPQYGAYQYNPMANIQRFQSQEQIQPQIQQPVPQQIAGINGRIVQAVENINANEVPMDGSMAFSQNRICRRFMLKVGMLTERLERLCISLIQTLKIIRQ